MDFQLERKRLIDDSYRNAIRTILSAIRLVFLKILDVFIHYLGISKSILYFLLFDGNNRRGSSTYLNRCDSALHFRKTRNMNFSSLKRRLFEKRGKKKPKAECSVYILDSPPSLVQQKGKPSEHEPNLPTENSAISKDGVEIGFVKVAKFEVVADVHRNDEREEDQFTLSDIGNGDFENKHDSREKITELSFNQNNQTLPKRVSPLFYAQNIVADKTHSNPKWVGGIETAKGNLVITSAKPADSPKHEESVTEIVKKLNSLTIKDKTAVRESTVYDNIRELERLKNQCQESHSKDTGKSIESNDKANPLCEKGIPSKIPLKSCAKSDTACQKDASLKTLIKPADGQSTSSQIDKSVDATAKLTDKTTASSEQRNPSKSPLNSTDKPESSAQEKSLKVILNSADALQSTREKAKINTAANKSPGNNNHSCVEEPSLNDPAKSNATTNSPDKEGYVMSKIPIEPVDFEDLDYDLVSVAFKHAIIPEKLQAAGEDLEIMIQKCLYYALKRDSEQSDLTGPIADVSPILEDLEAREKQGNRKTQTKRTITKVAFEAAYIKHECDKMINSCNEMTLPYKKTLKNKDIETLTSTLETVKEDYSIIVKYFQRLKAYSTHSDKLASLIIYRTPVYDHVDTTMYDLIDILTHYKRAIKAISDKIKTLEETRKNNELVERTEDTECTQSAAHYNVSQTLNGGTCGTRETTHDKDPKKMNANQSPKQEKESTLKKDLSKQTGGIVEAQVTNTSRKKSWKANRVSELRSAAPQTDRRIIVPIKESWSRGSAHDRHGAEAKGNNTNSITKETIKVSTNDKRKETTIEQRKLPNTNGNENIERGQTDNNRSVNTTREGIHVETGGGDGLNVRNVTAGIATSTPKKKTRVNHGNTVNQCPNVVSRRKLISGGKVDATDINSKNEFNGNEEIVSSFCDGGEGCLDEIDVDNINEQDESATDKLENKPKARESILAHNAAVMNDLMNKSVHCDKSFNDSLNSTRGSNITGNTTRDFSDLSRSFTSYIETNNTIDFSSLEVKPTHGDRVNKKKLQAEIKPKKKKTRGIPNQHLEQKTISKVKEDHGVGDNLNTGKNEQELAPSSVDIVDEVLDNEEQKARRSCSENFKTESKQEKFVPKPMNYEHWQTIDQREILMVPDQVHYQGESKLKDVEDMYTVSSAKGKKKKKKKEKKTKTKQPDDCVKHCDDEFFM